MIPLQIFRVRDSTHCRKLSWSSPGVFACCVKDPRKSDDKVNIATKNSARLGVPELAIGSTYGQQRVAFVVFQEIFGAMNVRALATILP